MTQKAGQEKHFMALEKFGFWTKHISSFWFFFFFNEPIIFHPAVSKTFLGLKTGRVLSVAEARITS